MSPTLHGLGIELIQALQSFRPGWLVAILTAVTRMGDESFFLFLVPFVWLAVDPRLGLRLALPLFASFYVNATLKDLLAQPRPNQVGNVLTFVQENDPGFPSGHAQNAVVVWGVLALVVGSRPLWGWAIGISALMGFSRVYLGVHFPTDVLGGWLLGALLVVAYAQSREPIEAWLSAQPASALLGLSLLAPAALVALHPTPATAGGMGALAGCSVGAWAYFRSGSPEVVVSHGGRALRFVLGLVGVLALYAGLRKLLPGEHTPLYLPFRFVRYAVLGLWMAWAAPTLIARFSSSRAR